MVLGLRSAHNSRPTVSQVNLRQKLHGFPLFIFTIFASLENLHTSSSVGSAWNNECLAVCDVLSELP